MTSAMGATGNGSNSTESDATSSLTRQAVGKLPENPKSILVADDEHLVATGISSNLSELGYLVVGPAGDGEEAVDLCRTHMPCMALLDIRMPKLDGLQAAEVIYRQLGIPVVIFSAYCDRQYVESCSDLGVFGYLLKPVTQDQLRVGVSIAWSRYVDHATNKAEINTLKQRLEDRKMIEQAKWIIVERKQISEPDAMKMLQRQARNNRRTLVDVARSVLENETLFSGE